tara:strand:- start:130 stop:1326 length:1197 start_codon:yes stop_codon:yes gene_type:complete
MTRSKIIIVGGGLGGLAAALALAQKQFDVTVLEQADQFREVGAGIQLGPNVFRMFKALDLVNPIEELAVFPDALVMRDAITANEITRIPINTASFKKQFGFPYGVIYRPDLLNVLKRACEQFSNIKIIFNKRVLTTRQTETSASVICEDQSSYDAEVIIGADGLWSEIRKIIVNDEAPRVSGHIAYRAVLPLNEVPDKARENEVILWAGPRTHLVQYPLHRGEIMNLVAVFHSHRYEEGWDVYGESSELKERFSGHHVYVLDLLAKINSWKMWVLCDREPVKNWSNSRISLLGDAAHPMLQYLAQGGCMAIEDAVCLAYHLDRHSENLIEGLQAYQKNRYLRTARVQLTARFYGDVYHATGPTAELRDLTLGGRTTEQAYAGMSWLYNGIDEVGRQKF